VEVVTAEAPSRLCVEERPRGGGPVVVHQVPLAPSRPILCTDDPEASMLKAVELLLAYPELDALPIVSPMRCTVVAHLTLSYCLAYILPRMRGNDLLPLATIPVRGNAGAGAPALRKFDSKAASEEAWAQRQPEAGQVTLVLTSSQTVRDLLLFFSRTYHSGVPVVEDNGSGGVLGLLSRRDLLNYLDLAMQTARRCADAAWAPPKADRVEFDLSTPAEAVLAALRRFRGPSTGEAAMGAGATFVNDKELTLKVAVLRLLDAENRKLLFVEEKSVGQTPKLLRIVSVSDVWRLMIGTDQEFSEKKGGADEELVTQDI